MIDEKKLIEAIDEDFCDDCLPCGGSCRYAELVKLIRKQPKVGEWIPCSERLPNPKGNEEFVRVEVTIQGKEKNVNMPAFYYYRIHKFFPWNIGGSPLKNVIAWMPLPEPYKAGDT